jgi:hypothetical protein
LASASPFLFWVCLEAPYWGVWRFHTDKLGAEVKPLLARLAAKVVAERVFSAPTSSCGKTRQLEV